MKSAHCTGATMTGIRALFDDKALAMGVGMLQNFTRTARRR